MADTSEAKWLVQNGDLENLKNVIDKVDINADVGQGRQLIHVAADYGQYEVIDFLLSKGANIEAADKYGITPLMNAVFESHIDSVKLLLSKGADKTKKTPSGESIHDSAESNVIKDMLK